jgi:hypothetical protein
VLEGVEHQKVLVIGQDLAELGKSTSHISPSVFICKMGPFLPIFKNFEVTNKIACTKNFQQS